MSSKSNQLSARWLVAFGLSLFVAALPVSSWAQCTRTGSTGGGEVVGTLIGAAIGGLLGSRLGSGTGNKVAIGAGVLAGGLLGNKIGRDLDCEDRAFHDEAAQDALEYQRSGVSSTWENPDSGNEGNVTPVRTYQRDDGTYCRDFTQTIIVDGEYEEASGTACREEGGLWEIVSS